MECADRDHVILHIYMCIGACTEICIMECTHRDHVILHI